MKITKDAVVNFRCPRYNELPDVELYMDQVVGMLEKKLSALTDGEDEHVVTSTMINNYVKQKLISPPVRKKYDRSHIAQLIVILIFKRVLSITEIKFLLERMKNADSFESMYDRFCDELDNILQVTFENSRDNICRYIEATGSGYGCVGIDDEILDSDDRLFLIIRAVALSFSCKLFAQYMLDVKIKKDKHTETEPKQKGEK